MRRTDRTVRRIVIWCLNEDTYRQTLSNWHDLSTIDVTKGSERRTALLKHYRVLHAMHADARQNELTVSKHLGQAKQK